MFGHQANIELINVQFTLMSDVTKHMITATPTLSDLVNPFIPSF